MLVTQEKNYVSIYIKPTIDLTLTLKPSEKGVLALVGWLNWGNPYYGVVLGGVPSRIKSTNANIGGSVENETMYHLKDFFSNYQGKAIVGRIMNTDAKVTVAKQSKDDDGNVILEDGDEVNVFGADNIRDWDNNASNGAVEILVTSCISEKHSIQVENVDDILTFKLYDENGNETYKVSGSAYYDALDDNGKSYYIGNKVDKKIVNIKVDTGNSDYESNFNLVRTYENGNVSSSDDTKNYANAIKVINNNIEKCDYCASAGLRDNQTLQDLHAVAFRGKVPMIIDLYGDTKKEAKDMKTQLNITDSGVQFVWNRGKDKFDFGDQNIGLSGDIVGKCVLRNLSKMVDDVEFRVEGTAGEDYPLPRVKADELDILEDDDLTYLADNRINTVGYINDVLCIMDILSANPKNVATKLFPVADGNLFINKYIARILQTKIFKNMNEAKAFVDNKVGKLFEKAYRNGYFNKDVDTPYDYVVSKKDGDTIVVNYQYVFSGVMRKGEIQGMIVSDSAEIKINN